jgi:hypothetical protein
LKVQEVEAELTARIAGVESEENRLLEWLKCLREVETIAERMGCKGSASHQDEGSLMKAFEELVEQAGIEEPSEEDESAVEACEEFQVAYPGDEEKVGENEVELAAVQETAFPGAAEPAHDAGQEGSALEVPDEGNLDRLRESLSKPKKSKTIVKNRFGTLVSSFFSADED